MLHHRFLWLYFNFESAKKQNKTFTTFQGIQKFYREAYACVSDEGVILSYWELLLLFEVECIEEILA